MSADVVVIDNQVRFSLSDVLSFWRYRELLVALTVREVRAQSAIATDGADSLETRIALKRLSRVLASDQPLRTNVPRGFYLSFTI